MRQQWSAIVYPAPSAGGSTLLNGLQVYYKLEDTSDSAGGGLTLTNNNSVTFGAGKVNNAATFASASSKYLSRADNSAFQMGSSTDFSVAIWLKFPGGNQVPFGYGQWGTHPNYQFTVSSTSIEATISDGTTRVATGGVHTFSDNAWHLAIMTAARIGNLTLYVDNATEGTPASISSVGSVNSSLGLAIGSDPVPQLYLDGSIDEVGIWNRVLTSGERTELWNGGTGKTHPFT